MDIKNNLNSLIKAVTTIQNVNKSNLTTNLTTDKNNSNIKTPQR
jgi:hypothetical protein